MGPIAASHARSLLRAPGPLTRFALALALALASGCMPGRPDADSAPSVLLVTIDTLRADHLGVYGYPRAMTSTFDRLASTGTLFLRAYASTPLTIPSHATILTGKYPPAHGVRDDGDFTLGPDQVTLADRFHDAGYATIAATSSFTTRGRWGLSQGFDAYREPGTPGRGGGHADQRPADETVDAALQLLSEVEVDRPVFMWVHLYDPHYPYDAPPQWAAMFPSVPYDAEIAFVDDELGRLLVGWELRFGAERSIVAVTAPQGESLGDGGERFSGFLLNDGALRVPLVVRGPGMEVGAKVMDPVGLVDLAPTLLDLAGLGLHRGLQGDDLRDGGSDAIYSESLVGQYNLGLAPMYAITEPNGRYVEGVWGAFHPAFGAKVIDEGTRMDVRSSMAGRLRNMRRRMGHVYAPEVALDPQTLSMLSSIGYVGGDPKAVPGAVDPRDILDVLPEIGQARRMIDFGMHLQARQLLDELGQRLPDTFGLELMEAQLLYRQGRLAEADRAFQRLFFESPSNTVAQQLASVAVARGRWLEASEWYEAGYWLDSSNTETLAGRVRCAYVLEDWDKALSLYGEMVARYPNDPQTTLIGAELSLRDLQPQAVLPDARWAMREMPWSAWAHAVYGRVLWDLGRYDTSIQEMQSALRLDPYPEPIRIELVSNLLDMGLYPEALRVSAPLARMLADHRSAQEVYRLASESLTDADRLRLRRDRAKGPDGRLAQFKPPNERSPTAEEGPAEGPAEDGGAAPTP